MERGERDGGREKERERGRAYGRESRCRVIREEPSVVKVWLA